MSQRNRQKCQVSFYAVKDSILELKVIAKRNGTSFNKELEQALDLYTERRKKIARPIPAINSEQWSRLSTISSNLNQLAYWANKQELSHYNRLYQDLMESKKLLQEVRDRLIADDETAQSPA